MIRCRLVEVTRSRSGKPLRAERVVAGDPLRVGRGADCQVHLPDPRINLHAAAVHRGSDGTLHLESEASSLKADGVFEQRLKLREGLQFHLGPYLFEVEPAGEGQDLVLAFELVQPLQDDLERLSAASRTSLEQAGFSKRRAALVLGAVVLLVFLALPVLYAVSPSVRMAVAHLPVAPDQSWSPGPMSAAHRGFGNDCSQCHQVAFVQVRDQACTRCHEGMGPHVADAVVQAEVFSDSRCASCHREHKGETGLARGDPNQCTDCHGDIRAHAPSSSLVAIADFGTDHPPFRLSLADGSGSVVRVRQDDVAAAVERSGLVFPHDVHVAASGVKSPEGTVQLACIDCHAPDESGVRFKPIAMQSHCASCHRLDFEPAVTTRQVPHGDPAAVMTALREFYSAVSIGETPIDVVTMDGAVRRPGARADAQQRQQAAAWVEAKTQAIAKELFEERVCQTCHVISHDPAAAAPWAVSPVNLGTRWLPGARFEHDRHGSFECSSCHAVAASASSQDIAIPALSDCRSCHGGASPAPHQLASTCATCHGFHLPGALPHPAAKRGAPP